MRRKAIGWCTAKAARAARRVTLAAALALLGNAGNAAAQLRPIDPILWEVLDPERVWLADVGIGMIRDQQASLAGTRGNLLELGNFRVGLRSGRIGVEIAGTLVRRFNDVAVFAAPALGADPPNGTTRQDAGDIRASTMIRLNGERPLQLALRFGTRLPTTSDETGLDRDRTDFFATVGGHYRRGALSIGAESGVAINGTRVAGLDQLDVWMYSLGIEYRLGPITSTGTIVGHNDMHRRVVRGNEDLNEVRLGVRTGERIRFAAVLVRGLADFSPARGLLVSVGMRN